MNTLRALPDPVKVTALAVILLDESTKILARTLLPVCLKHGCPAVRFGPVELVRIQNAGSALGFAQGLWLWTVVTIAGLLFVPVLARRSIHPAMMIGVSLVAGGAISNLADRLVAGSVTDFISPGGPIVVNLADVALALGCLLMSWSLSLPTMRKSSGLWGSLPSSARPDLPTLPAESPAPGL